MEERIKGGEDVVRQCVKDWSHKYMHRVHFLGEHLDGTRLMYEVIFSLPEPHCPVPVAVVRVFFTLIFDSSPLPGVHEEPHLTYRFENETLVHDPHGTLAKGKFEVWIDRLIRDKLKVRKLRDLSTAFEQSRLVPPPDVEPEAPPEEEAEISPREAAIEAEAIREEREREREREAAAAAAAVGEAAEAASRRDSRLTSQPSMPLEELLTNIFDAADEEDEGLLSHKEVSELLYATPLGLTDWDIRLLLTTTMENADGYIDYLPFVEAAPMVISALQERREAYESRGLPAAEVTDEAIILCFGQELEETTRLIEESFRNVDSAGTGMLTRHEFRQCIEQRSDRFSPQEVAMLMQMVEEEEDGRMPYSGIFGQLQKLRRDAFHNALVETDLRGLRHHLVQLIRKSQVTYDFKLPIWTIRDILFNASQLCLSRIQIHVLLSILMPDPYGQVDCRSFLRVACTAISQLFDTQRFRELADQIAREKADEQERAELEELQGLTGGVRLKSRHVEEDEESDEERGAAPDRETVEKNLIHLFNVLDEKHRGTIDVGQLLLALRKGEDANARFQEVVTQCQLSDAEVRGFVAEAVIDDANEIAYVEHVKTWIPIILELRN
ncbi:unnamed protein product [Vitrella brassicaformis CCMP3155]|uniref:EF-hand domain-containing protein n=1 Tax=Vitrella brassicaformis (strain CCMP3155) TaxID=1169540 RepID=A0A0G4H000_VITBC|nr:unnamed protein product [Vitrella brassicaformis CCMP3155]|eukprot:CEM36869.1 unnamed protein product [Vitrella brassicaformis CCMP3155]